MSSRLATLLALLTLMALAGCPEPREPYPSNIYFRQMTAAPASLTGEVKHPLNSQSNTRPSIRLSEGAIIGLSCQEDCNEDMGLRLRCEQTTITVSPPELADVRDAYLSDGTLRPVVLIGKQAGMGTIVIASPCVSNTYDLTIEE